MKDRGMNYIFKNLSKDEKNLKETLKRLRVSTEKAHISFYHKREREILQFIKTHKLSLFDFYRLRILCQDTAQGPREYIKVLDRDKYRLISSFKFLWKNWRTILKIQGGFK